MVAELREQVRTACTGVEKRVKDRQTASGVKDAYTQYWIEDLIKRARKLKAEQPGRSESSVQAELFSWAEEHASDIYSPFLTLEGMQVCKQDDFGSYSHVLRP